MIRSLIYIASFVLLFASCKLSVKPEELYGKWKYTKVEHPDADPPDSLRSAELAYHAPYIQFTSDNKIVMMWGGKVLSHGKFSTEGQNIKVKEELPGGKTRDFPFWVIKLTDKELVFETTNGADKSRVTAVKE